MAVEHGEAAQPARHQCRSISHERQSSLPDECRHVRSASTFGRQTALQRLPDATNSGPVQQPSTTPLPPPTTLAEI